MESETDDSYDSEPIIKASQIQDEFASAEEEVGYITAPIDAIGPPGRWIRHRLLESILYGTPVLLAIQRYRYKYFTKVMHFASFLGTEEFYAICVCFLTWIVDMRLGRLCCIAMAIGFYVANFVKNLLCLPRPPCPPVRPLEDAYYTWGLPSHHAVLGVVAPWYIWFYCLMHYHLEVSMFICLFMVITAWSLSVLFSRVYLGVHSPADVVVGSLLGCLIVTFMIRFDNHMELSSLMTGQGSLLVPIYAAVMLCIHPYNEIGLAAFHETTSMVGCAVGFVLGRAFAHGSRQPPIKALFETHQVDDSSLIMIASFIALRFIFGALLVLITKTVLKIAIQTVAVALCKLADIKYYTKSTTSVYYTGYSSRFLLPPVHEKKKKDTEDDERPPERAPSDVSQRPWNISHPIRYLTYIGIGFAGSYLAPALLQWAPVVL